METKECQRFDSCSAPICPLCSGDIWYADEDICSSQKFKDLVWIKNQRKISKRAKDNDTYYTIRMLEQNCVIGRGIKGLDTDHDLIMRERDEDRWLQEHPIKLPLSEGRRKELKDRMMEVRQRFNPH